MKPDLPQIQTNPSAYNAVISASSVVNERSLGFQPVERWGSDPLLKSGSKPDFRRYGSVSPNLAGQGSAAHVVRFVEPGGARHCRMAPSEQVAPGPRLLLSLFFPRNNT